MNTANNLNSYDVIIAGAGLSGLACAYTLEKNNISYLLLENAAEVGGKIKTLHEPNSYKIDLGFQVLLNSYSELHKIVDLKLLKLQPFNSGALVLRPKNDELVANPLAHPTALFKTLSSEIFNLKDKVLLLKIFISCLKHKDFKTPSNITTHNFLNKYGFSKKSIELFWTPFFSGVFLDKNLSMDSNFFLFLLRNFSLGSANLPMSGMSALPIQIAKALNPDRIKCSTTVKAFASNTILLNNDETLNAKFIVKAFNENTSNYRSATTYYFSTEDDLIWDKWLCLVSPEMNLNINHLAVLNKVAPDYSPQNTNLISATVIGQTEHQPEKIAAEIQILARKKIALKHIKTTAIKNALPSLANIAACFKKNGNYYECGDHTCTPSIQGALKSGRKAAEDIIYNLKCSDSVKV